MCPRTVAEAHSVECLHARLLACSALPLAGIACWLGRPAAVDHKLELAALSLSPAQMGSKRLTQPQASIIDPNDDIALLKACKDTAAALCHSLDQPSVFADGEAEALSTAPKGELNSIPAVFRSRESGTGSGGGSGSLIGSWSWCSGERSSCRYRRGG